MPYFLIRETFLSPSCQNRYLFVRGLCVFIFFCMSALCKVQNCLPDLRQRNCRCIVRLSCTRKNIVSCSVYMAVKQTDDVHQQMQRPKEWLCRGHSSEAFYSETTPPSPIPNTLQCCTDWHMSTYLYYLPTISLASDGQCFSVGLPWVNADLLAPLEIVEMFTYLIHMQL